ncbi:acyl-CoA dehydrogenase family protein [Paraburkholderia sp. SUR17]|uniref:acyl-CoA dehydrogenase family protein n=1 Tax=Paraburkholderia sp. SUR17 TaxID=3034358 RepID=UPI00240890FD|nr:acyl-CoA dehydrogenase family protein [Paraburkholderia sp. SUR17]WEY42101.1 oxidoreductase [Paraburkholderia sp. SUR17]
MTAPFFPTPRFDLPTELTTETGRELRNRMTELVPLIRQHALAGEAAGEVPAPTLEALTQAGAFKLTTPVELGGYALGIRDVVDIVSEIGRADGAAGWMAFVAGGTRNLLPFPEQAVEEVFSERDSWQGPLAAGASVFSTRVGEARVVEGGYMVKGTWHFGSGCKHAGWVTVGVEIAGADGVVRRGMALLKRGQYEILDDWHVMGMRGTCSNSVTAREEVFVPAHRYLDLAELGPRMDALKGKYRGIAYRVDARGLMLVTHLTVMAIAHGMAKGALECFMEQTQKLKPFNLPYETVADMPSTQIVAAKADAMIGAAQALIQRYAEIVDCSALEGTVLSAEAESQMTMHTAYGAKMCDDAVGMIQLCLGSSTARDTNPIQRFVRDIRVANLHGAVRVDPLGEIYGRYLLGRPPFGMFAGGLPDVAGPKAAG